MQSPIQISSLPPLRRLKNLWILVGAGATATALLTGYLLWASLVETLDNAATTRRNLATVLEVQLDATLRRTDTVLEALARTLPAEAYDYRRRHALAAMLATELDIRLGRFPEVTGLRIWDAGGHLLHTSGTMPEQPVSVADRDYFIALRDTPGLERYFSKPLRSRVTGAEGIVVARAVRNADGSLRGMVAALIDLQYVSRLFESLTIGEQGVVAIRRTDDFTLVVRWPRLDEEIGKPLPAGNPNRELIADGRKEADIELTSPVDHVRRLVHLHKLDSYPFYIVVGQARETVLAHWQRRLELIVLTGFVMVYMMVWTIGRLWVGERYRQAADAQIRLLASVFEHSGEAILITDADNRIVEINPAFTRITGYTPAEARGKDPKLLSAGRTSAEDYAAMWQSIRDTGGWHGEIWDRHKDGHVYPKWLTISTIGDGLGATAYHIGSFTDITARKAAEERIHYLAHHDALTHLPNRTQLQGRLEQALASARREDHQVAVLFIDMDHFKHINDSLGHHVGDALLVEVAERLRQSVRDSDIVARLGGDEFVVVLADIAADTIHTLAGKVQKNLSRAYRIGDHALHSTPSIGISLFPADGADVETLMKNADTAMYHAKESGRNTYKFFTPEMNAAATERITLEGELRRSLERGDFVLHYQPQIDVASGRPCGVEALVRWQHPERGMISPARFIPIAEETGLIIQLGEWVLDTAFTTLAEWRRQGIAGLRMAINLSAHQLRDPQLVKRVHALLVLHDLGPGDVELEITESVAMKDPAATIELLKQIRALGVELAIDDFGTGYSSLAYLKQLPLDRIKLDRSFVMDIEHDSNDAAISAATISLAHSLGLSVVAEGVETATQHEFLRELDCDIVQGYHFSRPLPKEQAGAFVADLLRK